MKDSLSLLLLLLSITPYLRCQRLESIPSTMVTKTPGETLSLSCRASGYNFGDYAVHWIRQKPGGPLEWIGWVRTDTGEQRHAESMGSRLVITKDNSRSMSSVTLSGLGHGDTAVYFCARGSIRGVYFDYWGQGTEVTVAPESSVAPTLFPLAQCGAGSDGLRTYACLATAEIFPGSATFYWTQNGENLTDFIQYPPVKQSENKYSKVSQVTVNINDMGPRQDIQCSVQHPNGKVTKPILPPRQPATVSDPSVELGPPSVREMFIHNKAVLECAVTGTNVNNTQVKWKVEGKERPPSGEHFLESIGNGWFRKVSKLEVDIELWFSGKKVECLMPDSSGEEITRSRKIAQGGQRPEVFLYSSAKNSNTMVCEVRGTSDVYIMWQVNKGAYQEAKTANLKQDNGNVSVVSMLIVDQEITDTTSFTCAVKHGGMENYSSPLSVEYSKSKPPECLCD